MSVILFLKSIVKKIPDKQTPERILVTVVKDYKKKRNNLTCSFYCCSFVEKGILMLLLLESNI